MALTFKLCDNFRNEYCDESGINLWVSKKEMVQNWAMKTYSSQIRDRKEFNDILRRVYVSNFMSECERVLKVLD